MTIINHSTAKTTEDYFPLADVPQIPLLRIFSKTDLGDLIKLPQLNKYFYNMMQENSLWKKIAKKIGCSVEEITDEKTSHIRLIRREFIEVKKALENLIKDDPKARLPKEVSEILNRITKFDAKQNCFIEVIPTYDEIKLLKDYLKARDTLAVWHALTCKEAPGFPYGYSCESARETIDLANGFSDWFTLYKPYFITLTNLNLAYNKLSTLPDEIGQLKQLKTLSLLNNNFVTLPPQIKELDQLEFLELSNNYLSTISSEIGQLHKLQHLYLSQNNLSTLPAEIGQLHQLQELDLSANQLSSLPAEIGQLTQLKVLGLSKNNLSTPLPSEIGQLHQLQEFYLSFNRLSTLPAQIGQLHQLQELHLSANQLSSLPPEICQLHQLQRLSLDQNNLYTLPSEIGQMNQLWELNLSANKLSILPPEIYRIPHLFRGRNPISFMNDVNYFTYTHGKNLLRIATVTTLTALAYFYPNQMATSFPYVAAIGTAVAIQKLVHRYSQEIL